MFYLLYVSSAVKDMSNEELIQLLKQSRLNNFRNRVTGMLLYKGGNFMQIIEGEKDIILKLFDTIKNDGRHKDVIKIMTGDIEKNNFRDWSMGFMYMNEAGNFPDYDDYIQENLNLRSFQNNAEDAYKFIVSFNQSNS